MPSETGVGTDGNNCAISYASGDGGQSVNCRVRRLAHEWSVIATESHARGYRAMYPRQRAIGKFALTFEFNGYKQHTAFMHFMSAYAFSLRNSWGNGITDVPLLSVVIATRKFSRLGVPIKGMYHGDHVGSMVFTPTIVFLSARDPLDTDIITASEVASTGKGPDASSKASDAKQGTKGDTDAMAFFYPFSPGSEDPNVGATKIYGAGHDALHPTGDSVVDQLTNGNSVGITPAIRPIR